jgi:plasmid stabilization system protein ParE
MAREVVWTGPAWEDLETVAAYIARDSEFYAATLVRETRDAAS